MRTVKLYIKEYLPLDSLVGKLQIYSWMLVFLVYCTCHSFQEKLLMCSFWRWTIFLPRQVSVSNREAAHYGQLNPSLAWHGRQSSQSSQGMKTSSDKKYVEFLSCKLPIKCRNEFTLAKSPCYCHANIQSTESYYSNIKMPVNGAFELHNVLSWENSMESSCHLL